MKTLILPAELDSLSAIRQFVKSVSESAKLNKTVTYNLQLALDEIATNVIVHGYDEAGRRGDLTLQADIGPRVLRIILEDSGVPFDSRTLRLRAERDLSRPIEERPIGGLGVYLAFRSVDRFDYEWTGDKNRNIFEVNLTTLK